MQIFIPTRDRINAQFTWQNLGARLQAFTTLVVPKEQLQSHLDRGRRAVARPPVGLAAVRQWIVSELSDKGQPVIMCDDDLSFFVRKDPSAHNLRPANSEDVFHIFDRLNGLVLDGSPDHIGKPFNHAGLSPRQGNNWAYPDTLKIINRMNAVHCVWAEALAHYNIRYDDVDMMEDYRVVLGLLQVGEKNAVITDCAWDQNLGSGAPGGFSHYRTSETQAAAAHKLHSMFPETVKVVEKEPSTGAGGFSGKRTDVRIQWVQTYNKGTRKPTYRRSCA